MRRKPRVKPKKAPNQWEMGPTSKTPEYSMAEALKKVAGNRMKSILGTLTTNRLMGLITGTFVTAVIQSSSVTTVMLVGFVTAGLMSLAFMGFAGLV